MNVIITGSNGRLGSELTDYLKLRTGVAAVTRNEFDISEFNEIWRYMNNALLLPGTTLINCAAMTGLPRCEAEWAEAYNTNVNGVRNLVAVCNEFRVKLIHISTDYVYDGSSAFHTEDEVLHPVSHYAITKALADQYLLGYGKGMILRTSFFPKDISDWKFAYTNKWTSGDYVDIIAEKIAALVLKDAYHIGIVNVGTERKTFYELAYQRNHQVEEACAPEGTPLDTSMLTAKYDKIMKG